MDIFLVVIFLFATFIFFIMISENASIGRCPYEGGECFDGNGKYQYKGRGCKDESVHILLSRIDWVAKNSNNKSVYTTSYIIAYTLTLSIIVVLYATSYYVLSVWEYVILLMVAYIITFSITNLIGFHTDRYPIYYIRNNIGYITNKLGIEIDEDPGHPCDDAKVPYRTQIQDKLRY
jgi:hypothetical protein